MFDKIYSFKLLGLLRVLRCCMCQSAMHVRRGYGTIITKSHEHEETFRKRGALGHPVPMYVFVDMYYECVIFVCSAYVCIYVCLYVCMYAWCTWTCRTCLCVYIHVLVEMYLCF